MTSGFIGRVYEHKYRLNKGFAAKYGVVIRLVWYEVHESVLMAIEREKQLRNCKRAWKLELIEEMNSDWCYLYDRPV